MIAKILLCGEGFVGKTSIRERFIGIKFRSNYLQTIGADYTTKIQKLNDGNTIKLQIWDLAGQQRFATIRESFYKGCDGIVLIFDVVNPHTSEKVFNWIDEIDNVIKTQVPIVLVGNKIDLRDKVEFTLSPEEGEKLAQRITIKNNMQVPYIESSAMTGKHIDKIFSTISQNVVDFQMNKPVIEEEDDDDKIQKYIDSVNDVIQLYFFKMTEIGPNCVAKTKESDDPALFFKMAVFYSTTLGQGLNAHKGVFGPLPIPESGDEHKYQSIQAIIYSFNKSDKNHHDPRAKGINFCFIVITIPKDLLYQFSNKNVILRLFHDQIDSISDIEELNVSFLQKTKKELLKNIYLTNNS